MSREKHYEMLWDCQFCGTKKLLGKTHRFCPNCGAPQNPASRYFPSDAEKVAVEDHVFVGADITCPACGQLNAATSEYCQQCGSPLAGGIVAQTLGPQSRAMDEVFESSGSRDVVKEKFDAEMERIGVKKKNTEQKGIPRWLIVAAVVALLVIGGAIFLLTRTVEATVNVVGHEWTRTTYVQQYSSFVESNWWNLPPMGDNVVRGACTRQQRSVRQVPDGEDCRMIRMDRGDGTFSESQVCTTRYRSEPIYDDWCTFSGYRWEPKREVVVKGGLNDTPDWGSPNLNCADQRRVGCERIDRREEVYELLLRGPEHSYRCAVETAMWRSARIEQAFKLQVMAIDNSQPRCETLEPVN
ncbi:zinc ribbon domain-containing protein [Aggregatilineales bacterium SYSU G02658]